MTHTPSESTPDSARSWYGRWTRAPLALRILAGMVLGIVFGLAWNLGADSQTAATRYLLDVGKLILRLLSMIALPLIFVAIIHALLAADVGARTAKRLAGLLLTNTFVAILIGLLVANLLQPGSQAMVTEPVVTALPELDLWDELKRKIPDSFFGSLVPHWDTGRQDIIPAILIALGLGIAIRRVRDKEAAEGRSGVQTIAELFETFYSIFLTALNWIVDLVPLAVFSIVAHVVATQGMKPFISLLGFVGAVLIALTLQTCYYLARVSLQSWVKPLAFLRGGSEALLTAFSTASSTASAPLNYKCLREKIGLREESAAMGALVGSNFNNDGTALYEAMGPLYIAQMLGQPIPMLQQPMVALMAVVASVGAPGIPEAGLVTMVLVFQTVGLPTEYVALLLPIDWFLDRCRTMVNVLGDMSVACVLDGNVRETQPARPMKRRAEDQAEG
ncbi:MAG: dicarboxylate/amino acid:cation symporter [Methylotetracoccus sp.]|nr:dicarboxylate/amino acid:cation symporter [Methylotetracoccus sp.]